MMRPAFSSASCKAGAAAGLRATGMATTTTRGAASRGSAAPGPGGKTAARTRQIPASTARVGPHRGNCYEAVAVLSYTSGMASTLTPKRGVAFAVEIERRHSELRIVKGWFSTGSFSPRVFPTSSISSQGDSEREKRGGGGRYKLLNIVFFFNLYIEHSGQKCSQNTHTGRKQVAVSDN